MNLHLFSIITFLCVIQFALCFRCNIFISVWLLDKYVFLFYIFSIYIGSYFLKVMIFKQ